MVNLPNRLSQGLRGINSKGNGAEDHTDEASETKQNDVLERLNVVAQTSIPEHVMSSRETKAVRFARSQPGYYFPEVEQAMDNLSKTVSWYESALHQRDLDVHKLAQEADQLETALTNQRYQVESLSVTSSSILVDDNDQPLSADSLEAQLAVSLEENRTLREALEQKNGLVAQAKEYTDWQGNEIESLRAALLAYEQGESVPSLTAAPAEENTGTTAELEESIRAKEEEVATLAAQNAELATKVEGLHAQIAAAGGDESELSAAYTALQEWAEQVTPEYEDAIARITELEATTATLQEQNASLEVQVSALNGQLETVKEYVASLEKYAEEQDAYITSVLDAADAVVEVNAEVAEVANQYLSEASHEPVNEVFDAVEEEEQSIAPSIPREASTTTTGPKAVRHDEDADDHFANVLSEMLQPEVSAADFNKLKQSRPTMNYAAASPGAPLTSLRPGESMGDVL